MYPTITDLIYDLFGVYIPLPIQSFGFFVALSFLLGAYSFTQELKRKENNGLLHSFIEKQIVGKPAQFSELFFSAISGFLLGYKLIYAFFNYSEFVSDPQGIILSFEGSFIGGVLSALTFVYLKYREKEKLKLDTPVQEEHLVHPYELIGNIVMISFIAGILGAKIFHNLENVDDLIEDPLGALLSFSGLTFYGGLICGAGAVLYYTKSKKLSILHTIDAAGPGLMLSYGIGRIGCQVAGDGDWGIANTMPQPEWLSVLPEWIWAYDYPNNVLGVVLADKVFPTPLYESALCIALFGLLWAIRKKITIPGILFSIYLVMNGVERFLIEKIRVNEVYEISNYQITQAEIISFCLVLLGLVGIFYCKKKAVQFS